MISRTETSSGGAKQRWPPNKAASADLRKSQRKTISPIGFGNPTKLSLFPIKSACFEPAYSTYCNWDLRVDRARCRFPISGK